MSTPIDFPLGIPGFGPTVGTLTRLDGSDVLWSLDTDIPDIGWVCADPWAFKPDFELQLSEAERDVVGDDPTAVTALVIINATDPARPTGNYLAPIVVNLHTQVGIQAVQSRSGWTVAEPLANPAAAAPDA